MLLSFDNTFGCTPLPASVSSRLSPRFDRLGLLIELQRIRPGVKDSYRSAHRCSEMLCDMRVQPSLSGRSMYVLNELQLISSLYRVIIPSLFTGVLTRERYNGAMKNAPALR